MKSLRRTACVIACIAVFLASLASLAACAEDNTDDGNSATGYSLSGKITLDGQGLGGVGILVDGETSARSDANGVFSVSHLAYGDEVAFALEGYHFSPESYVVKSTVNDLSVRAYETSENPSDVDPDDDEIGEGDVGDGDESEGDGNEGEDPPVFEQLSAPLVKSDESAIDATLTFYADPRSTDFTFSFAEGAAATVSVAETAFVLGGKTFYVACTKTDDALLLTIDLTPLQNPEGAAYTVTLSSSARGFLPSDEVRVEKVFAPAAPSCVGLRFDEATEFLSWELYSPCGDTTCRVYADGVFLGETSELGFGLADRLPSGEHTVTVVVCTDGIPSLVSAPLVIVLP